ncbi:MAG: type I secretion system permease/ATPase [Gammaproteobacteria bacterium]|nr:type I secretion system permease/ATPase [Gammaproteobacteria bacterium]
MGERKSAPAGLLRSPGIGVMTQHSNDALKPVIASCRRVWGGVAAFSAFLNLLMLAVPLYMMQIFDRVLPTGHIDTLFVLTAMVTAALIIFGVLDALRGRILARVGAWLESELSEPALSSAVVDALRVGGGTSAQGLRDLATVRSYAGGPSVMPLFDAPWAPVFLAVVFLIHPLLGWIGIGGALLLAVCAVANDLFTRKRMVTANDAQAKALNEADAAVRNADTIAAMGILPALLQRRGHVISDGLSQQVAASEISSAIIAFTKASRFALQVAMLGVGAYLVIGVEMTPGGMIAASIVLARGLAPIEQSISGWRAFVSARAAWRRLRDLLHRSGAIKTGTTLPRPKGVLELEGVSYAPPARRSAVIHGVNLRVEEGKVLGIVGPSGAGKTTLVRLIVGSLAPTVGHVRLDGADMAMWPDADRGRHVGYLPQNVELFAGTVRDNIARLSEAPDETVVAASELAGAHKTVLALDAAYETRIGEGGIPISGGQRQRIALARAVFGNPVLVVLDEPNAHLDSDGEWALIHTIERLRELGVTIVLVAQRAPVMVQTDHMVVIKDGTMAAYGPTEKILDELRRSIPSKVAG